jgi:hypothetical protein
MIERTGVRPAENQPGLWLEALVSKSFTGARLNARSLKLRHSNGGPAGRAAQLDSPQAGKKLYGTCMGTALAIVYIS